MGIQLKCDFCRGAISGKTQVLKFANFERFFCCTECRFAYKKKYSGRIEALTEGHILLKELSDGSQTRRKASTNKEYY
jgi:Archaeal TRASH domain